MHCSIEITSFCGGVPKGPHSTSKEDHREEEAAYARGIEAGSAVAEATSWSLLRAHFSVRRVAASGVAVRAA